MDFYQYPKEAVFFFFPSSVYRIRLLFYQGVRGESGWNFSSGYCSLTLVRTTKKVYLKFSLGLPVSTQSMSRRKSLHKGANFLISAALKNRFLILSSQFSDGFKKVNQVFQLVVNAGPTLFAALYSSSLKQEVLLIPVKFLVSLSSTFLLLI